MRNLLIILFLINLISCKSEKTDKKIPFNCMYTETAYIYRCENQEVVCYIYVGDAMQCNFKK
jgi:hypothetical protein